MPPRAHVHGGRGRDHGVVAVETALVSTLLLTILFGIVEASVFLKDALTVSAAARAGARLGSSEPRSPGFATDSADQVANAIAGLDPARVQALWVYSATATGKPDSGNFTTCTRCVTFTWNGTAFVGSGSWSGASQNACLGDPGRESLGVYVSYRHASLTGFMLDNQSINEATVMALEPFVGSPCKP